MNPGKNIPEDDDVMSFLSREKYFSDHILNNSRSMISIINRDYVYEKVNVPLCKALKGAAESIVGKSLGDVWGLEVFRKYIKENIDKCFCGDIVRYEASFIVPQAGRRIFEVIFRPLPEESGEILHLLAETFDITDLKLSEKNAIEKEEEFRKFETNLPIGFLRCKPDGEILHANRAFMLIIESSEENDLYNRNLRDLYSEEDIFDLHIGQLTDNKPKTFGRVSLRTCCDNEIVCRISAFMCLDQSGEPAYVDYAFEDSSRELMLESRLLQAQKLETIGALAGGIAHDFNNILATISGYSELLQEDLPKTSPSYQKVARIQMAITKARYLTNQMLTFSRHVEQEKVVVNVYEVLSETIGFIKSAIPSNVTVRSRFLKKNAPVLADPTQLFRVFLNLMTNAIQSLEDRVGTISVTLAVITGKSLQDELNKMIVADEYVQVTFRDTGKGMDPSLLRRIFEPFFTTREVGKGSGLGLSVVHGIATEMGGEIMVSSKKGKGSVFYLYLPVSRRIARLSDTGEKGKRILFIMGNKHESRILSIALESAGYELNMASDRKSLVLLMSDNNSLPDLIIYMSDAQLIKPEDLLEIFQNSGLKIPCILIHDPDLDFHEEKLVNSGIVSQHLIKPVSLKEIKNAIQFSIT